MSRFNAGAGRWLGIIAKGLKRPAFERMHPSFVADAALTAYAGHESTHLNSIVGSLGQPQNHEALSRENYDPCWSIVNQSHTGNDVHPEDPVSVTTTDERIKIYSGLAVGYLQGNPAFSEDLARLSAQFFAGLSPADFALTALYEGDSLVRHFGFGDKGSFEYVNALCRSGGAIADIGMGTHAIIYQNMRVFNARMTLVDNNRFSTEFNRAYIENIEKTETYTVVDADVTQDPPGSIAPESVAHAGSRLLTHHIFKESGSQGLKALAGFLWHILPRSGTFRIFDFIDRENFEPDLVQILKAAGFSIEGGGATHFGPPCREAGNQSFIIDGWK